MFVIASENLHASNCTEQLIFMIDVIMTLFLIFKIFAHHETSDSFSWQWEIWYGYVV